MRHATGWIGYRRGAIAAVAGLFALAVHTVSLAQNWPSKPIRVVVPYPPGGSTDLVPRLLQPRLSRCLANRWWLKTGPAATP